MSDFWKDYEPEPTRPAPVREDWGPGPHEYHSLPAPVQEPDYKQLYEQVCEQYDVLAKELDATNRQVEILSDALAESRREVTWGVDWGRAGDKACVSIIKRLPNGKIEVVAVEYQP